MGKKYWLVKQEPEDYSWSDFVEERKVVWSGVRNFQARNNLRAMAKGDLVFFYHSGEEKRIVGLARVAREAYVDPTATEGDWVAVDLVPIEGLNQPVDLKAIKSDKLLRDMVLARNSRLSVSPVTSAQFDRIMKLAENE